MQRIDDFIASAGIDKSKDGWRTNLPKPTPLTFDPAQTWSARCLTSKGEFVIKLMPDVAPMHVTSFAYLARLGFFEAGRLETRDGRAVVLLKKSLAAQAAVARAVGGILRPSTLENES